MLKRTKKKNKIEIKYKNVQIIMLNLEKKYTKSQRRINKKWVRYDVE
jgi:hypothetical protein